MSHLCPTTEQSKHANLAPLICKSFFLAFWHLQCQCNPPAARLGRVEQDVRSETLTETPAQHDSTGTTICSHSPHRHLPTNCILRRAAELLARKRNSEKGRRKGKVSWQALRDREIKSALHSHMVTANPAQLLYPLLHPCSKRWSLSPRPLKTRAV